MCEQRLKITVRKDGEKPISVAEFKDLSLFEKLSSRWFGNAQKVMVIIAGNDVKTIQLNINISATLNCWTSVLSDAQ